MARLNAPVLLCKLRWVISSLADRGDNTSARSIDSDWALDWAPDRALGTTSKIMSKHELNKCRRVTLLSAAIECGVVFLLVFADERLDGYVRQERVPLTQDQRLPQSAHAAVAVFKGVNKIEFIVKNQTGDQRTVPCG